MAACFCASLQQLAANFKLTDARGSNSTSGTQLGFELGAPGLTRPGATETSRSFVTSQQIVKGLGLACIELGECLYGQSFQYVF